MRCALRLRALSLSSTGDARFPMAPCRALIEREIEWLREGGAERHAVLADNGVPWALADLALHVGEMLSVPLPGSFTPAQVAHALDDAGVDAVLTDDAARARSHCCRAGDAMARRPSRACTGSAGSSTSRSRAIAPAGTRKITYTSGSTSNPKGVCLSGPALEAIAESVAGATRELAIERHLCILPLATLLENVAGLYAPLLRGATCVVPPSSVTGMSYGGLDAARLLGTLSREQPNSLILVPELLQVLVVAAERGWQPPASLQFVAVGGAKVSRELLARADAAGIPVYEGYGLSECASVVCLEHARIAPRRHRRPSVAARARACRCRRAGARRRQHDARLPRRSAARAARRNRDRRPWRVRCRRLPAAARPHGQPVHHQLWPQRVAGVGRVRNLAAPRLAGRCSSTARHALTSSRSSGRPHTTHPTQPSKPPSLRRMRYCRTTRRCAAGRARPVLSRLPTAR